MKKQIAIMGATGQVGTPLTKTLLAEGHQVRLISRRKSSNRDQVLDAHVQNGAEVVVCKDMADVDSMAACLEGCDTLVCAVPGSEHIITVLEPIWLKAAVKANVKRFVPTEFGAHTRALEYGDGVIFDRKKQLHEKIFEAGIGYTFIYNGVIFDYLLPNLRFFEEITTFGNLEIPLYTHQIEDIGRFAALAITDDRTLNRCVQMDYNHLTQTEMLEALNQAWPNAPFVYKHYSTAYIKKMKAQSGNDVTAKKGAETDAERWGINNVIYVIGKLAAFTEETVRGSELFPDFVCKKPEDALRDLNFIFEQAD